MASNRAAGNRGLREWDTTARIWPTRGTRFWKVHSYVIAYRWETTPIQIIAVVHGARQLEAFRIQ
jgi:plasmid stabilization system protein ParE